MFFFSTAVRSMSSLDLYCTSASPGGCVHLSGYSKDARTFHRTKALLHLCCILLTAARERCLVSGAGDALASAEAAQSLLGFGRLGA